MKIIKTLVLKTFLGSGHYIRNKCGFHGCDYENYSLLGRTNLPTFQRKMLPSLHKKMNEDTECRFF